MSQLIYSNKYFDFESFGGSEGNDADNTIEKQVYVDKHHLGVLTCSQRHAHWISTTFKMQMFVFGLFFLSRAENATPTILRVGRKWMKWTYWMPIVFVVCRLHVARSHATFATCSARVNEAHTATVIYKYLFNLSTRVFVFFFACKHRPFQSLLTVLRSASTLLWFMFVCSLPRRLNTNCNVVSRRSFGHSATDWHSFCFA